MNKKIILFFLICINAIANAQYTSVINSNRPGFSESPYAVGKGIYQLETGFFYINSNTVKTFSIPNTTGFNIVFRTSILSNKLEFNLNTSIQKDKVAFKNIFTSSYESTGISELSIGAKYLIYHQEYDDKSKEVRSWKRRNAFDWKRIIPSVALYLGAHPNLVNDNYKLDGATYKIGILFQNNLSRELNIITNFYIDQIGNSYKEYAYIITGTMSFSNNWSTFLEHQAKFDTYEINNNIGIGLAYLFSNNLQIDVSTRLKFNKNSTGVFTGLGFSYRFDRHFAKY